MTEGWHHRHNHQRPHRALSRILACRLHPGTIRNLYIGGLGKAKCFRRLNRKLRIVSRTNQRNCPIYLKQPVR